MPSHSWPHSGIDDGGSSKVKEDTATLTRRSAIKRLLALIGGTMTATQVSLLSDSAAALADDAAPMFLDEGRLSMLGRVVDLIIPETGTPGALGVGVHRFIDMMLAEWASEERQARWIEGLAEIDRRAAAAGMANFVSGSAEQQFELLQALDTESFSDDGDAAFFSELKKMVVFAYYSTEIGATVEMAYQPVPGIYQPCTPLDDDGRAWYWNGYSYGL